MIKAYIIVSSILLIALILDTIVTKIQTRKLLKYTESQVKKYKRKIRNLEEELARSNGNLAGANFELLLKDQELDNFQSRVKTLNTILRKNMDDARTSRHEDEEERALTSWEMVEAEEELEND